MIKAIYCIIIGYFIGTVNPSYIIGRVKGFDIRKKGSGNAGGSNALITMGKTIGFLCIIFDILKAFAVVKLTKFLFPRFVLGFPLTAGACILGHIFPFYLKFRGGKGLACIGGSVLAFSPRAFFFILAVETVLAFLINYICVVPITASVFLPIMYGIITKSILGALILGLVGVVVILKHRENIARIMNGTEAHLSFLWKKEEELDRFQSDD